MAQTITQRELRNDSGEIMRRLDEAGLDAMALDKKALRSRPRFVTLDAIGSATPYVRWINLRTCPEDQASLSRARAGMTDGQESEPIGWRPARVNA